MYTAAMLSSGFLFLRGKYDRVGASWVVHSAEVNCQLNKGFKLVQFGSFYGTEWVSNLMIFDLDASTKQCGNQEIIIDK